MLIRSYCGFSLRFIKFFKSKYLSWLDSRTTLIGLIFPSVFIPIHVKNLMFKSTPAWLVRARIDHHQLHFFHNDQIPWYLVCAVLVAFPRQSPLTFRHKVSFKNLGWSDFLLPWRFLHNFLLLNFWCPVLSILRTSWFLSLMFACHQSSFRAHWIFFRTNSPNPFHD